MAEANQTTRKKTGRPPKSPDGKPRITHSMRLRGETRERLIEATKTSGLSISEEIERRVERSFEENSRINAMMNEVAVSLIEAIKANKAKPIDETVAIELAQSISRAERENRGVNCQMLREKDLAPFISSSLRTVPDLSIAPSWSDEGDGILRARTHNPPPDRQGRPAPLDGGPALPPDLGAPLDAVAIEEALVRALKRVLAEQEHEGLVVLSRGDPRAAEAMEKDRQAFEEFKRRRGDPAADDEVEYQEAIARFREEQARQGLEHLNLPAPSISEWRAQRAQRRAEEYDEPHDGKAAKGAKGRSRVE